MTITDFVGRRKVVFSNNIYKITCCINNNWEIMESDSQHISLGYFASMFMRLLGYNIYDTQVIGLLTTTDLSWSSIDRLSRSSALCSCSLRWRRLSIFTSKSLMQTYAVRLHIYSLCGSSYHMVISKHPEWDFAVYSSCFQAHRLLCNRNS